MESEKKSDLFTCCAGCCGCLCLLTLIVAVVSFYVFGILFLVQDYETCKECEDSLLWTYVLITLILALCNGGSAKGKEKDATQLFCFYMGTLILQLCLGVWGGVELWIKSCDTLIDSNIWIFATWTFGLQMCAVFFSLCGICISCLQINNEVELNTV
jgi:hypothetical protein